MARITRGYTLEDLQTRSARTSRKDLTREIDELQERIQQGDVGGEITLDDDDESRTVKRSYTTAAGMLGWQLTWRGAQGKQPPGAVLKFALSRPGEPVPGSRPRKPKEESGEASRGGRRERAAS